MGALMNATRCYPLRGRSPWGVDCECQALLLASQTLSMLFLYMPGAATRGAGAPVGRTQLTESGDLQ